MPQPAGTNELLGSDLGGQKVAITIRDGKSVQSVGSLREIFEDGATLAVQHPIRSGVAVEVDTGTAIVLGEVCSCSQCGGHWMVALTLGVRVKATLRRSLRMLGWNVPLATKLDFAQE